MISPAKAQRRKGEHKENFKTSLWLSLRLCVFAGIILFGSASAQGPDYSKFLHTSQRHSSIACSSCHERIDNSATPRFPGHKACTDCHRSQFTTPAVPMCVICHTGINSNNPPLNNFAASFNEP